MKMPIATLNIKRFNDVLQADTKLVCPKCGKEPRWQGQYTCDCCSICGKPLTSQVIDGKTIFKCEVHGIQEPSTYKHWSMLKRVMPNGEPVVKPKLTQGEDVEADAYIMDIMQFSKYADATLQEYGVIVKDDTSARNIRKLLIAMRNLGKIIVLHFNDTYEERVAVLTTSISNRIILKELVPLNLADIEETMRVSLENVTEKDVQEAEAFIKQLPTATEDLFYVHDYRIQGLDVKKVSPKVLELEAILAQQTG